MKATFNYTDRKKIKDEDCVFTLTPRGDDYVLEGLMELGDYGFPDKARVIVEAFGRGHFQRFDFGTVDDVRHKGPAVVHSTLDPDGKPGLKVKVIPEDGGSRLLGLLKRKRLDDYESLLGIRSSRELGQLVWALQLPDSSQDRPELEVNAALCDGDPVAFCTEPNFASVVFPSVLREVLWHIIRVHSYREATDDPKDCWAAWLRFASKLWDESIPERGGDSHDYIKDQQWIDECVRSFARQNKYSENYRRWQENAE